MSKKIIENMEVKVINLRKDLRKALQKVEYLVSDLNKLKEENKK